MAHVSNSWRASFPSTIWPEIEEAQNGDEEAIEYCCRRYRKPVRWYFIKSGLSPQDAEDLTQEMFKKMFTGAPLATLRPREVRFRSYLRTALENKRREWIQHINTIRLKPPDGVASLQQVQDAAGDDLVPADEDTPWDEFVRKDAHGQLDAAIERVQAEFAERGQEDHFDVFALRFWEQPALKWGEIGDRFGISEGAARGRARVVMARLGQVLRAELADEEIHDFIRAFQYRGGSRRPRR